MEKHREQSHQHNLDRFQKWSRETIEVNKKRKGDIKHEQKQETAGL